VINISHIAVPYSKALFDLSHENNALEETYKDIELVSSICLSNRDFRMLLKSPIVHTTKKIKILHSLFETKISKLTLTFLSIITRKKRESFIPDISLAFIELYKNHQGILPTHLKTAGPITESLRKQVIEVMKRFTGKEIELMGEIKQELIGGFILQWDDKQYDTSILNQIKKIKKSVDGSDQ
jgi:F-type H+-transporting ATPase subunit delta